MNNHRNIVALIVIICTVESCSKEKLQIPNETVSQFKIQFYDSFSSRSVSGIQVQLIRTVNHFPFVGPSEIFYLDTFISDSNGQIMFALKHKREEIYEFSLKGMQTPEAFLPVVSIPGDHFSDYNIGRCYNVVPATFIKIREFDILKNDNQKCDFYQLKHHVGSGTYSLISWTYGQNIGTENRYVKLHYQRNDSFTANYGCAAYRGYKSVKINLVPFDTVTLSNYFPK